jgi:hypothetical protein
MTYAATTTTADGTFTGTADTMPEAIRRAQYAAGTLKIWMYRWGGNTPGNVDVGVVESEFCKRYGQQGVIDAITALLAGKVVTTSDGWILVCKEPYNGGVNVHRS